MKKIIVVFLMLALVFQPLPLAKVDSAVLQGHQVVITATIPCPSSTIYAKAAVKGNVMRIAVYQRITLRGGQCASGMMRSQISVPLTKAQMRMKIFVNGVLIR